MSLNRYETWRMRPVHTALTVVSRATGVCHRDIKNNGRRWKKYVGPRQLAMWLAVELGAGLAHTGRYMGFDHTTVLHGRRTVERKRAKNAEVAVLCADLVERARQYR